MAQHYAGVQQGASGPAARESGIYDLSHGGNDGARRGASDTSTGEEEAQREKAEGVRSEATEPYAPGCPI